MKIKIPEIPKINKLKTNKKGRNRNLSEEKGFIAKTMLISLIWLMTVYAIFWIILFAIDKQGHWYNHVYNAMGNIISGIFVVVILDLLVVRNNENRKKRDERRAIVRHNKIIQPVVDLYIVRKNMVITPNDKTVRKFQVNASFTIRDMRDMYGPSELISDVGKSKIEIYAQYQSQLQENLIRLVEDVDFLFFPEVSDAAMKYINATSYGASALNAVLGYQDSKAGTKSMRAMVTNMIREEPLDGRFIDATPAMKNIYILSQTINDQEVALADYLKQIQRIIAEEPTEKYYDPEYE